jgi:hypothetical protein
MALAITFVTLLEAKGAGKKIKRILRSDIKSITFALPI